MSHNENDCSNIHIEVDFHTTVILYNTGGKTLQKWYTEVFCRQHPNMAGDFEMSPQDWEGEQVMEIIANNPGFTIAQLFVLFEADTASKTEDSVPALSAVN